MRRYQSRGIPGRAEPSRIEMLQQRKLELEILRLRRPWWKNSALIVAALPAVFGLTAAIVGLSTGYFDVERRRLELDKSNLQHEVGAFDAERDRLRVTVRDLGAQSEAARDSLAALRHRYAVGQNAYRSAIVDLSDQLRESRVDLNGAGLDLAAKQSELKRAAAQLESISARIDTLHARYYEALVAKDIAAAGLSAYIDDCPIILGAPLEFARKDFRIYGLYFGQIPGALRLKVTTGCPSAARAATVFGARDETVAVYTLVPPSVDKWERTEIGVTLNDTLFNEIRDFCGCADGDTISTPYVYFQIVRSAGEESEWFNSFLGWLGAVTSPVDSWDWSQ